MNFSIENNSTIERIKELVITVPGDVTVPKTIFRIVSETNSVTPTVTYLKDKHVYQTRIYFIDKNIEPGHYKLEYLNGGYLKNKDGFIPLPDFTFNLKENKATITIDEPKKEDTIKEMFTNVETKTSIATEAFLEIKEKMLALKEKQKESKIVNPDNMELTIRSLFYTIDNTIKLKFNKDISIEDKSNIIVSDRKGILNADIFTIDSAQGVIKLTIIDKNYNKLNDLLLDIVFRQDSILHLNTKLHTTILFNARKYYEDSFETTIRTLFPNITDEEITEATLYILKRINDKKALYNLTSEQIAGVFNCVIHARNSPYNPTTKYYDEITGLYLSAGDLGDLGVGYRELRSQSVLLKTKDFTTLDYNMCFMYSDGLNDLLKGIDATISTGYKFGDGGEY